MKAISTPVKQLLKDTYFLGVQEVETMCSTALYIYPIQEFLDKVATSFTLYELNGAMAAVKSNFAGNSKASWEDRQGEVVLTMGLVSIHVIRGSVKCYQQVPHTASSTHMGRLEKKVL